MTDNREEQLRKVPPLSPFNHSMWPEGVRTISMSEADGIGVDAKGELWWRGKPVEVRRPLYLSSWQKLGAAVVAGFTVVGAIGAVAQGWAAYNEWACKVSWRAVCPADKLRADTMSPPRPEETLPPQAR